MPGSERWQFNLWGEKDQSLCKYDTKTRFSLYQVAFAHARKPYRIGLLFTHRNGYFRRDFCDGAKHRADWSLKWRVRISDRWSYYTGYLFAVRTACNNAFESKPTKHEWSSSCTNPRKRGATNRSRSVKRYQHLQWRIQGRPFFLDQTEGPKGRKKFFWDRAPPYLRVWMTAPSPSPII